MKRIFTVFLVMIICSHSYGQKPRARELGVPFVGTTGEFNAITDVEGVEVGYSTIISGKGENIKGKVIKWLKFTLLIHNNSKYWTNK